MEQRRKTQWNMPSTRLYAPTYGSLAYAAPALEPQEPQIEQEQLPVSKPKVQTKPRVQTEAAVHTGYSFGGMILIVLSILMLTGMLLLIMTRYANIASAYSMVNEKKAEIQTAQLRLAQLNVDMQCAVDPERAREVAREYGMSYPSASQYVRVGENFIVPVAQTQTVPDAVSSDILQAG